MLDFGISKVRDLSHTATDARMTGTKAVFGSPMYMSPEQMLSARDVDPRTDIWALGTILYELLAGKSPFEGETLPEVFAKISTLAPPPIRNFRPDVPLGVESVILKCLEKDRTKRYLNVAELAIALAPFAPKRARASVERVSRVIQNAGLSASVLVLPPSSDANSQPQSIQTEVSWGQTAPPASGKKWMIVAALGVMTALGLVAALFVRSKPASHNENAAAIVNRVDPTNQPSAVAAASHAAQSPATNQASATAAALPQPVAPTVAPIALTPEADAGSPVALSGISARPSAAKNKPANSSKAVAGGAAAAAAAAAVKSDAPAAKDVPAAPKANCDPPYFLDAQGREQFKPECFKNR